MSHASVSAYFMDIVQRGYTGHLLSDLPSKAVGSKKKKGSRDFLGMIIADERAARIEHNNREKNRIARLSREKAEAMAAQAVQALQNTEGGDDNTGGNGPASGA
jgi:hypothetical protein